MSAAECAACKRRFSSDSAFDRHQTLPPPAEREFGKVICHDPEARGLVLNRRGRWGAPPSDRSFPPSQSKSAGLTEAGLGAT